MMKRSLRRLGCAKFLACAITLLSCGRAQKAPNTSFSGPTGMALAGRAFDKVYVANTGSDTLQVLSLQPDMRRIDFVPSPARYFPLNIPGGPNPQEVAATTDGRFVFVLDKITSTVRLIDADAVALVQGQDHTPVSLPLGASDVEASALVASPWACAPSDGTTSSVCLGRAYVGLRRLNAVAAIDVRQALSDGSLSLVVDSTVALGAAPVRMAAHPTTEVLFITDAQAPQLLRINLAAQGSLNQAVISRVDLRAPGGAVAVSGDGKVVAVARPAYQDVALWVSDTGDVASGTLAPLDANPVRTPLPQCVVPCDQAETNACEDAHVADSALCSKPVGYGNSAHPYTALYLGSIPTALVAIDANTTGLPLTERCTSQSPEGITQFGQGFAVASMDGTIEYIGLYADSTGAAMARILDKASCDVPRVKGLSSAMNASLGSSRADGESAITLDTILAPCAPLPQGRARMACLRDIDGDSIGRVGVIRGHSHSQPVALAWEGILPNGDRSGGGGIIDGAGRLYDGGTSQSQDLKNVPIRVAEQDSLGQTIFAGDILQMLSLQLDNAACGKVGTSTGELCELERRIVATQVVDGRTRLVFDRPLDSNCFAPSVPVAYRIRAGDGFLAGGMDERGGFVAAPVRLNPGQTYGEGLLAGATGPLFFTIDPNLDVGANLSACERYLPDGTPNAGMPRWRGRKDTIAFSIVDPFAPLRSGEVLDPLRNRVVNSGQMPFGMVMTKGATAAAQAAVDPPALLITFAGSDGLLIASPLEPPTSAGSEPKERLLQ